MSPWLATWTGFGVLCLLMVSGLLMRRRAYRRVVSFDPRFDYRFDFSARSGKEVSIEVDREGFTLPADAGDYDTGLLELRVRATPLGSWRDPVVELLSGNARSETFFERRANGVRYLNVSPFLEAGGRVESRGRYLLWDQQHAVLRLWRNDPLTNESVLVIASHPDDAEIAAHALYARTKAHILTICAGDRCSWNFAELEPKHERHAGMAARLRMWDGLTIPWLAGVPPEHCIQLGYPDDKLAEMKGAPKKDFRPDGYDFAELRRLNRSRVSIHADSVCSWQCLINDLRQALTELKPAVVVLPFPRYDNHRDHGFSTLAVCEALKTLPQRPDRFLLYINHSLLTEHWPFGPAGTAMSLPPNTDGKMPIPGLWSRPLTLEEQREKFLALEAMHDLREPPRPGIPTWRQVLAELRNAIGTKVHGMERRPNSYFRRAVRSNELFFAATCDQVDEYAQQFAAQVKD